MDLDLTNRSFGLGSGRVSFWSSVNRVAIFGVGSGLFGLIIFSTFLHSSNDYVGLGQFGLK